MEREPIPSVYPPLVSIVVGREGSAWIELREAEIGRSYLILSAEGEVVGRARAIESDELDVQSVVRYSIMW